MARHLSDPEVAEYRTGGQWGNKYLAVAQYHNVYSALLSAVPSSTDRVIQISFDNGAGVDAYTVADVREDMTLYVASAGASVGDYDLGMCRIRKVPTESGGAGTFYIGETSNIEWVDNAVLTIVDDYQIRPKPVRVTGGEVFIDSAIDYVAQHSTFDPMPVLGTHYAVWLDQTDEGEKITNGTFTTTTAGWTAGAGALLTIVSNALHIDRNGGGVVNHASQTIKTKTGKTYLLSVDIKIVSHQYQVYADGVLVIDNHGTGVHTASFVATAATTVIAFRATSNAAATLDIDNVTVNQVSLVSVKLGPGADNASWVLGSTIASVEWEVDGALSIDDDTLVNPTVVFNAAGTYLAYCTVTAVAGDTTAWGVRYVMVYDRAHPPITDFEITNRQASYTSGGWAFEVKVNSGADEIREHSLALLFSENYNDDGRFYRPCPIDGAEDIDCIGYLCKQNISRDFDAGSATFAIEGAAEYMKQMYGSACSLELKTSAAAWTDMPLLTVTRFVWHFLYWRTTATRVMDVMLPPDTLYDAIINSMQNSIWSQIEEVSSPKLFASPGVDCYGRFWLEVDPQMVHVIDRTWPVVQELAEQDWADNLEWDKNDKTDSASLASAGIAVSAGGNSATYYSLSPGHIPNLFGGIDEIMDNVPLVTGQTHSNELCGLLAGWNNNPHKYVTINFVADYRIMDLWPRQFLSMAISPADDPRGIGYSGNLIPRELSYDYDPATGRETLTMQAEAESFPQVAITGDTPLAATNDDTYSNDNFDFDDNFDLPPMDDVVIGGDEFANLVGAPSRVLAHDVNLGMFYTDNFNELDPTAIVWKQSNWGLTDTIYKAVSMIVLTSSGGVYVSDGLDVYYAPSPTSAYTVCLSQAQLLADWNHFIVNHLPPGTHTVQVKALGINKGSNGIGVIISVDGTYFKMETGDSAGFTALPPSGEADNPDYYSGANDLPNSLTYGGGLWGYLFTQSGITNNHIFTINSAGAAITDRAIAVGGLYGLHQARLGSSSSVLFLSGGTLLSTANNFVAQATVAAGVPASKRFAADITGQYLVGVDDTNMFKSTDGGSSWSAALSKPLSSIQFASNQFCVDKDRWIVIGKANSAAYTPIIYSPDGTIWETRYGNLTALFPSTILSWDLVQALP